jgi:SAM-dependent methyltransferase
LDLSDIEGKLLSGRVYPEFYPLPAGSSVVNLGCGTGPQAVVYKDQLGEMIGVDINADRVQRSIEVAEWFGIDNYRAVVADVESTGLESGAADVILAIDVIEHVRSPENLVAECRRLVKPGGSLLITYPTLHDKYFENPVADFARLLLRRKGHHHSSSDEWNPDDHNQAMGIGKWVKMTEAGGFKLADSRATTLFPPLQVMGVPRFWFKNSLLHAIDSKLSAVPVVKRFGQALVCRYIAV